MVMTHFFTSQAKLIYVANQWNTTWLPAQFSSNFLFFQWRVKSSCVQKSLATSPTPQTAGKKPEIIYIFILPIKVFTSMYV
jgi:hypothetical protein